MGKLEAGATAPAFTLPDQDEKPVKLSDFKGERVIVDVYKRQGEDLPSDAERRHVVVRGLGRLGEREGKTAHVGRAL